MKFLPCGKSFFILLFCLIGHNLHAGELVLPKLPDSIRTANSAVKDYVLQTQRELEKNLNSSAAWGLFGHVLYSNDFVDEALQAYKYARTLDPQNYFWPYLIAHISNNSFREDALMQAELAAELAPKSAAVHYLLGEIHENNGDLELAIAAFKKAYQLDPQNLATNASIGRILLDSGNFQESEKYLISALKLAPTSAIIRNYLLRLSANLKTFKDIIPPPEVANDAAPIKYVGPYIVEVLPHSRKKNSLKLNADLNVHQGNWSAAIRYFSLLEKYYALTEESYLVYAFVLKAVGDYEGALLKYKALLSQKPNNVEAHSALADVLFLLKHPEAKSEYTWLLNHHHIEKDIEQANLYKSKALQGLGRIAADQGNPEKALELITQAIALSPENAVLHTDLTRIYSDLKQFDKANEHLSRAEQLGMKVNADYKAKLKFAENQAKNQTNK